tara:strand:+ start:2108 stop:2923 length:816 start_codon:yes stop_codon:yes gene_type:complete
MKELKGKVALITGNSRGLGPCISLALAKEGVTIVGVARSEEGLKKTQQIIEDNNGSCYSIPADLKAVDQIENLLARVRETAGEVDILINNAGIETYNYFQNNSKEDIHSVLTVNLHAPMELVRLLLPSMMERGGHIVNIASLAGKKGVAYNSMYSASKAGMIMWTDGLRQELKDTAVDISVICPGFIQDSGMFHDSGFSAPSMLGTLPPQDVADAVVKALKENKSEVIVNKGPMKPLLALAQIAPELGDKIVNWFGVPKLSKMRAERNIKG